jgi:hypothetical protein
VLANQEKVDAWIAEMRTLQKEMTACQEVTGTYPEMMETNHRK